MVTSSVTVSAMAAGPLIPGICGSWNQQSGANSVAQSLRPFPQFGAMNGFGSALGNTWYDSLQLKVTKRFSRGLSASGNYTFSKNLQHISAFDVFNRANGKDIVPGSPPHEGANTTHYSIVDRHGNAVSVTYTLNDWFGARVTAAGPGTATFTACGKCFALSLPLLANSAMRARVSAMMRSRASDPSPPAP